MRGFINLIGANKRMSEQPKKKKKDNHNIGQTYVRISPQLKNQVNIIAAKEEWNFNQAVTEALKILVREKSKKSAISE